VRITISPELERENEEALKTHLRELIEAAFNEESFDAVKSFLEITGEPDDDKFSDFTKDKSAKFIFLELRKDLSEIMTNVLAVLDLRTAKYGTRDLVYFLIRKEL